MDMDREEFSHYMDMVQRQAATMLEATGRARQYVDEYEAKVERARVAKRRLCAAWKKRHYAADPEFRARCCAKAAERYQRIKALNPKPPAEDRPAKVTAPRGRPRLDGLPSGSEEARAADAARKLARKRVVTRI